MNKTVLVTGANGFIGKHICRQALKEGLTVYAGVRHESNVSIISDLGVEVVRLSYLDIKKLTKELQKLGKMDYLIHNAGVVKAVNLSGFIEGNVNVTQNLIEVVSLTSCLKGQFVYVSSLAARGPAPTSKDQPISDYGESKLMAERLLVKSNLPWTIIRPTAVYGPGDFIFLDLVRMLNNRFAISLGSRNPKLTFIHGEDLARLILSVKDISHEVFYGVDGKHYTQKELIAYVSNSLEKTPLLWLHLPAYIVKYISRLINFFYKVILQRPWMYNPRKISEILADDWTVTIPEYQKKLEFQFKYDLSTGFKQTIEDYKSQKLI